MLLLVISPLFLFVFLVFVRKMKLMLAAILSLLLTLLLAILIWQMRLNLVVVSGLKGISIASDILLIIFGALFFLDILKSVGIIGNIGIYLEKISPDYRVQVILLAWLLENFLEGTAGFGTPSTIVAPLLVGIGLSPIMAVAVSLLGNSASVVFGAAGAPIRIGFAALEVNNVPYYASLFNFVGFLVPLFMLLLLSRGQKDRKEYLLEVLPLAIFSGLAFVIPSFLLVFLGQEFPSIMGSIIAFFLVMGAIKLKLFLPKKIRKLGKEKIVIEKIPLGKIVLPYFCLIILLVLGKFVLGGIIYFNPGISFILASIPVFFMWPKEKKLFLVKIKEAAKRAIEPFLTIALVSIMVQIMVNSGENFSGKASFLEIMAQNFKSQYLPLITPFIGAFGSFLTGSATLSNIMFGSILQSSAVAVGLNVAKILALGVVGGAAGNMISLVDILPALAVVGLKGEVKEIVRMVIWPCVIYVLLVGVAGMLLI